MKLKIGEHLGLGSVFRLTIWIFEYRDIYIIYLIIIIFSKGFTKVSLVPLTRGYKGNLSKSLAENHDDKIYNINIGIYHIR